MYVRCTNKYRILKALNQVNSKGGSELTATTMIRRYYSSKLFLKVNFVTTVLCTAIIVYLVKRIFFNPKSYNLDRFDLKDAFIEFENMKIAEVESQELFELENAKRTIETEAKRIVVWNQYYDVTTFLQNFSVLQCPADTPPCILDLKRENSSTADAVLLHLSSMDTKDLPPIRAEKSTQVWVYYNYEPPIFTSRYYLANTIKDSDFYLSYREGSDIKAPYGSIRLRTEEDNLNNLLSTESEADFKKKGTAVWLVSNCKANSKRESYVKELQKYITVDIFGYCGKPVTFSKSQRKELFLDFAKKYKFYLSFENALCPGYITEKFFLPLHSGIVPVALGGGDYNEVAPEGSYINVFDFESPEMLAKHLKKLENDYSLYKEYFSWKEKFIVDYSDLHQPFANRWLCQFCTYLHNNDIKPFEDINTRALDKWWFDDERCWSWSNETNERVFQSQKLKIKQPFMGSGPIIRKT